MKKSEAEQLSILLLQVVARLGESTAFVRDKDGEEDSERYRRTAAAIIAEVGLELAGPIYHRFPELRPQAFDGPYEIDPAIYEPKFYDPAT